MVDDPIVSSPSRRSFLSLSAAASAALALRIMSEPRLALAARHAWPHDGVMINANENPLGPSAAAREAVQGIASQGGRYCDWLTEDVTNELAKMASLKPEYVVVYDGSTGIGKWICR